MKKGLLLGAGFSYDFGMPLVQEITEVFLGLFNKSNTKQLVDVLLRSNPYGTGRPINRAALLDGVALLFEHKNHADKNYEKLLAGLQSRGYLPGKNQSDRDSYNCLFSTFYDIVHSILSIYQAESYKSLYEKSFPWYSKFEELLSEEETWVFTLNHDLYLECLALDLKIPVTYGDINRISFPVSNADMDNNIEFTCSDKYEFNVNSKGFFKGSRGINLIKLHGGLSELEYNDRTVLCNPTLKKQSSSELLHDFNKIENMGHYIDGRRIPSGKTRWITNSNGEVDIAEKSMLTGGKKYSKTTNVKKGEEKLKAFYDSLCCLDELTVIGYGFGDGHINCRLLNAMVLNDDLNVRIVDPVSKVIPEFLQQFDYDSRVRLAVCGGAQWMEYVNTDQWNFKQIEALKDNEEIRNNVIKNVKCLLKQKYSLW